MMEEHTKKYRFILILYSLVDCVINFVAAFMSELMIFPIAGFSQFALWEVFLSEHKFMSIFAQTIAFAVPALLCFVYCFPLCKKNNEKLIKRRIVNSPIAFSLFGSTGWIINFLCELVFLSIYRRQSNRPISGIIISSFTYTMLELLFSFIFAYFILETFNRASLLPQLFPDGYVAKTKGIIKPSINALFLIFYISISVFPVFVITGAYLGVQVLNNIPLNYSVLCIAGVLLIAAFTLTIVFSRIFSIPLKRLKSGAKHIATGEFSHRIQIASNDEMGVLSDTFNDMAKSLEDKEKMRDMFGKIVDPEVRDYLLTQNTSLGGETCTIAVLFCDIRGFTTLSENMEPAKVVSLLNAYFTAMGKCITAHHGIINKYIGDAIMAIFGAPVHSDTYGYNAWRAALAMRQELEVLNTRFAQQGFPTIRFGIGLHSGPVLAGNIGAAERMEYTVIGDTVNTASRIESLCKEYKTDFLLSESVVEEIRRETENILLPEENTAEQSPSPNFTFISDVDIRGRSSKIKLYGSH